MLIKLGKLTLISGFIVLRVCNVVVSTIGRQIYALNGYLLSNVRFLNISRKL